VVVAPFAKGVTTIFVACSEEDFKALLCRFVWYLLAKYDDKNRSNTERHMDLT
jgi:hypothetical protein